MINKMDVVVNHDLRYIFYSLLLCGTGLSQGFHTVTQYAITMKKDNNNKFMARLFIFFIASTAGISITMVPFYLTLASREFFIIENNEVTKLDVHYSSTTILISIILTPLMCLCVFLMQESTYNYIVTTCETQTLSVFEFIKQRGFRKLIALLSGQFLLYIFCAFCCATVATASIYLFTINAISDIDFDITCDSKLVLLSFISFLVAKIIAIYGSMKFKLHFLYDECATRYITWSSSLFFMIGFITIQRSLSYSLKRGLNYKFIEKGNQGLSSMTLIVLVMFVEKVISYIIFNIAIVPSLTLTIYLNGIKAKEELHLEKFNSEIMFIERKRAFQALSEVLPLGVAEDFIFNGGSILPKSHSFTLVFFSDVENFTAWSNNNNPITVFNFINTLFSVIDCCKQQFPQLHKVETIGDAYM